MEPALVQFESENKSKLNIINVNVDSERGKLDKYPAVARDLEDKGSIPNTWVVDSTGKIVWGQMGGMSREELEQGIKPYL